MPVLSVLRRVALVVGVWMSLATVAAAQRIVYNNPTGVALNSARLCTALDVGGFGAGTIEVLNAFTGTITFYLEGRGGTRNQVDVTTADAPSTPVNSTTDTAGIWRADLAGYSRLVACLTAGGTGNPRVILSASEAGGGGGGGGAGGGAGDFDIATFTGVLGSTSISRTAALADNIALTVDTIYTASAMLVHDGAALDLAPGTAADGLLVNLGANNDVIVSDGAGALNVICDSGCAGGTQYTEGDTDASITGGALLFEGAADTLVAAPGTAANGLLVDVSRVTGTVTVSGTVTANLSATDNAVLDDIADGIAVTATDLDVQSGGADILSTTAFNAAFGTAGTADTQVLSVQGIASGTALTVSATNLDVQIGGSDTLTITDGAGALNVIVDSGTVTVTDGAGALNVICDSGCSGGSQYTEDAAAAADPVGNAVILVRADTPGTIASANGDNVAQRGTNYGAAYMTLLTSGGVEITPDTQAIFGGAVTFTAGTVPTGGFGTWCRVSAAAPSTTGIVDDDVTLPWCTGTGALQVGDAGGSLTVDAANLDVQSGGGDLVLEATVTTIFGADAIFGTAGTADADVLSVQGIASMTPLLVNPGTIGNWGVFADEAAFTYATSNVQAFGAIAESTTDTLADGTVGAPVMTLSRFLRVTPTPYATGGGTPSRYISAGATEDEHAVCTGACTLYGLIVTNTNAAIRYLKCENDTAANTAPGTDTPEFSIAVPATGGAAYSVAVGATFSTALTCWLVTGAADSDVAEVAANELMVNYVIGQ